jgi:hypothetical protein
VCGFPNTSHCFGELEEKQVDKGFPMRCSEAPPTALINLRQQFPFRYRKGKSDSGHGYIAVANSPCVYRTLPMGAAATTKPPFGTQARVGGNKVSTSS